MVGGCAGFPDSARKFRDEHRVRGDLPQQRKLLREQRAHVSFLSKQLRTGSVPLRARQLHRLPAVRSRFDRQRLLRARQVQRRELVPRGLPREPLRRRERVPAALCPHVQTRSSILRPWNCNRRRALRHLRRLLRRKGSLSLYANKQPAVSVVWSDRCLVQLLVAFRLPAHLQRRARIHETLHDRRRNMQKVSVLPAGPGTHGETSELYLSALPRADSREGSFHVTMRVGVSVISYIASRHIRQSHMRIHDPALALHQSFAHRVPNQLSAWKISCA
jgi:hypothetical protein